MQLPWDAIGTIVGIVAARGELAPGVVALLVAADNHRRLRALSERLEGKMRG